MIRGNPILLIDAGKQSDGDTDRAITSVQKQKRAFNCDRYVSGYIHCDLWNFGNTDNYATIACTPVMGKPFEFPFFHGTTPTSSSLYELDYDVYTGLVLADSTPANHVGFIMRIDNISFPFWRWRIEVAGTDASVNALLEFYPDIQ